MVFPFISPVLVRATVPGVGLLERPLVPEGRLLNVVAGRPRCHIRKVVALSTREHFAAGREVQLLASGLTPGAPEPRTASSEARDQICHRNRVGVLRGVVGVRGSGVAKPERVDILVAVVVDYLRADGAVRGLRR